MTEFDPGDGNTAPSGAGPTMAVPPSVRSVLNNVLTIYGVDLTLTQADLPYAPPSAGQPRLASTQDVVIHGENISVSESLVNAGRSVTINARSLTFADGAIIDTSGADGSPDFPAGQLPDQTDQAPGTDGVAGADAGTGGDGGAIHLGAETITTSDGSGNNLIELSQALADVGLTAWTALTHVDPLPLPDFSVTFLGSVAMSDVTIGPLAPIVPTFDVDVLRRTVTMTIDGSGLVVTVTPAPELMGGPTTFSFKPISISGTLQLPLTTTVTAAQVSGSIVASSSWAGYQANGQPFPDILKSLEPAVGTAVSPLIGAAIRSGLATQVVAAMAKVQLGSALLITQGGRGGRGQDGHPGILGTKGREGVAVGPTTTVVLLPGESPQEFEASIPKEAEGGDGGPGGRGGDAGISGPGGNAGEIEVTVMRPRAQLGIGTGPGPGGEPALSGKPGEGGPGGDGGSFYLSDSLNSVGEKTDADDGHQGPSGGVAARQGAFGADGRSGTASINGAAAVAGPLAPGSIDSLAAQQSIGQLQLVHQSASIEYLNATTGDDYKDTLARYVWIESVTRPFIDSSTKAVTSVDSADRAAFVALNAVASVELTRLVKGLDFYGHTPDWVPILSLNYLQERIGEVLALGQIVQSQLDTFLDTKATDADRIEALDDARAKLRAEIANLQTQRSNLTSQIADAEKNIGDLLDQLNAQRKVINDDTHLFSEQFRAYVSKQADCTFADVLNALGSITSLVGGASANPLGVANTAIAGAKMITSFANEIDKMQQVDPTVPSIRSGYQAIQNDITAQHPDKGKLLVEERAFDAFVTKFFDKFSSAEELDIAVHQFIELAKTRNRQVLAYNALYLARAKLDARIADDQAQLEQIAARRAKYQAPGLPDYVVFMGSLRDRIVLDLVRMLYEEDRAFAYWSATEPSFELADLSLAGLADAHERLSRQVDQIKTATGGPFQSFTQQIDITAATAPMGFAALPSSKRLQFSISPSMPGFENMTRITAERFTIVLPDVTDTTHTAFLSLQHSGVANVIAEDGTSHTYTHQPRAMPFKIDDGNPSNTAGGVIGDPDQGFAGLSPFTLWTLDFSAAENDWLDLSEITTVKLTFTGSFIAQSSSA